MLQVKFVKKPQKHILSFSKVLCAPSGESLSPLHIFGLVTKQQFKFSNTTLRWNFPQTFCVLNQQPFLLFCENPLRVEYWHIFNEFEDITGGTKPPISLATIRVAILLQYVPEGLESYMSGRSKRSLTRKLGQADRRGQRKRKAKKFLCSRLPPGIIAFSPNHVYVQIRQRNPVIWSFDLLYFTCFPSLSLFHFFTRGHKEELILSEELCWTKQYNWEGVFVEREW